MYSLLLHQSDNQTWALDPMKNQYPVSGQLQKTLNLDELLTWAHDMVMWYWSVDTVSAVN